MLLASARGELKRLAVASLRRCQRGDLGQIGLRFHDRTDQLVDLRAGDAALAALLLSDGRSSRLACSDLAAEDDRGAGETLEIGNASVRELVPLDAINAD